MLPSFTWSLLIRSPAWFLEAFVCVWLQFPPSSIQCDSQSPPIKLLYAHFYTMHPTVAPAKPSWLCVHRRLLHFTAFVSPISAPVSWFLFIYYGTPVAPSKPNLPWLPHRMKHCLGITLIVLCCCKHFTLHHDCLFMCVFLATMWMLLGQELHLVSI